MSKITEKELEILFPNKDTNLDETTKITIKPFTWKECYTVLGVIIPTFTKLLETGAIGFDETDMIQFQNSAQIISILLETQEPINKLITLSTGLETDVIDNLLPDKIIEILMIIFEVNSSFFVSSVLPQVQQVRQVQKK